MSTVTPSTVPPCHHTISLDDFTHLAVGPALLIMVFLSLLEKRRHPKRCRCCGDRPGMLVPVNLLDGDEDRFAYAAAFGSTASNCLTLFSGNYIPNNAPMWSKVFYAMLAVTEMGINYYPFFACLSKTSSLVSSFFGLGYSVVWFLVNLAHVFECVDDSNWVFPGQPIIIQLPVLACLIYLVITFLYRFVSTLINTVSKLTSGRTFSRSHDVMESLPITRTDDTKNGDLGMMKAHQVRHVKELLRGTNSNLPPVLQLDQTETGIWGIIKYRKDLTFKYSPRITATVTVALLCLYEFGLYSFLTIDKVIHLARDRFVDDEHSAGINLQMKLLIDVCEVSWYVAFSVSSVVMVNYVIRIFLSYRLHLQCLIKGDYSFIPRSLPNLPRNLILNKNLMYSGSQIAYILWGYYVMILAIFTTGVLLSYFIILPFMGYVPELFLQPFWTVVPTVIVSYFLHFLQKFVSKKVLLQKDRFLDSKTSQSRRVLAVNNRRIYHNVSYFLFFFYILFGLYECSVRIGKGIVLGVMYLARIDRSGLIQGYEQWDTGHMAYLSFLEMEVTHCHPVLVVFCQLMVNAVRDKTQRLTSHQYGTTGSHIYQNLIHCCDTDMMVAERIHRTRNRWLKAYTLVKNPSLIPDKEKCD